MIAEPRRYSAMKDVGVEWLGSVPTQRLIERLKSSVDNIVEQGPERQQADWGPDD